MNTNKQSVIVITGTREVFDERKKSYIKKSSGEISEILNISYNNNISYLLDHSKHVVAVVSNNNNLLVVLDNVPCEFAKMLFLSEIKNRVLVLRENDNFLSLL